MAIFDPDVDPQRPPSGSRRSTPSSRTTARSARSDLLERVVRRRAPARRCTPPSDLSTPYVNTIPAEREAQMPGRPGARAPHPLARPLERDGDGAAAPTRSPPSSAATSRASQSAATLYDVGFNHFWHAPTDEHGGDLVYIQGHSSPGIYARAFLEGRLTEEQLDDFRQEVGGDGLSSYPHPWLMPDFWQFPTVSMGLGPLMAIYQARFMKYLQRPRHRRHRRPQGLGVHGRRRDGRARVAGRDLARRRARSSTT